MTLFGGNRSVAVRLLLEPKGYLAGLAATGKATADWARAADASLGKHRRSWEDIGNAATKAGLVIGAGAAAAVVKFAEFDKSMSRARAGTQATSAEMDQLRAAALKAGKDTQFSATEAADAITAMGKAGVSVQDILGGGLSGALSLAAAGELQVGDAAEIAATALTQFGLKGSDLPHVADLLAAGAGKAQGSVTDLSTALNYVGPVAKSANVSIEETVGVLGELASQGIIGEQAGTSLRGVLQSLRGPSKNAAGELKALGIELYDNNGNFIGLAGAAEQLKAKLAGLPQVQRDAALATIFGNEQVTAATILMNGGADAVRKWTAAVNDQGYASRQAGQLMDNLSGDVEQLRGSLETAFISGGSGANSGLRSLVQGVTGAVNAFGSLPPKAQQATVMVAGTTAGVALLAAGLIKGAIAVRTMRTNLEELGVTSGRTGRALATAGRLASGFAVGTAVAGGLDSLLRSSDATQSSVNETTSALLRLKSSGATSALDELFKRTSNYGEDDVRGFTDALQRLADPDLNSRLNKIASTVSFGLVSSGQETLADQFHRIGQSLAEMVQNGQGQQAAQIFGQLSRAAQAAGLSVDDLNRFMPEYQDALVGVDNATQGAGASTSDMAGAMGTAAYKAGQLQSKLKDVRDEAKRLNDTFLKQRSAQRDYQQALADAADVLGSPGKAQERVRKAEERLRTARTASQKTSAQKELDAAREAAAKAGRSLDITTEAGRKAQAALDGVAQAAQDQADALLAAGGTDDQYRASLAKSREDLLKLAIRFGLTKDAAQKYVDTVLRIPDKATTDVQVTGVAAANAAIDKLLDKVVTVNGKAAVVRISANAGNIREDRGTAPSSKNIVGLPRRALGGPVSAGRDYLVGEKRAEVFRPSLPGYVFPSAAAAAASGPQIVKVPVTQVHRRETPVQIGSVTVVSSRPEQFTDWASTTATFGAGGVG